MGQTAIRRLTLTSVMITDRGIRMHTTGRENPMASVRMGIAARVGRPALAIRPCQGAGDFARIETHDMTVLDSIHDGRLNGIITNEKTRTVQLQCCLADGREVLLTISGVIDLCASNMRLGNIVLFAEVFDSADQIGAEALAAIAQSRDVGMQTRYVAAIARRPNAPRWFVLQSSYGVDLVCVFDGELIEG